jgi:phosphoribosylformylglycinamidine cyclo-ligase
MEQMKYKDAGVDLEAAEASVKAIGAHVRSTFGPHVVTDLGGFAGMTQIPGGDPDQLVVSSMDGVGTKLKVASMMGRFNTVGQDLVNHCVGDIGVHGAIPLCFLDYIGMGKLEPDIVEQVVAGLAEACRQNACALIGGETAEMPGVYTPPDFDLVGCIIGTIRRDDFVNGSTGKPGDVLLGFNSTGLHTNGYSLARRILSESANLNLESIVPGTDQVLGDALLAVHRSYLNLFRALGKQMKGAAHITGGGIPGNLSRILPPTVDATIHTSTWETPPLFELLVEKGNVPSDERYSAFNMGVGLIAMVSPEHAEEALSNVGEGWRIGELVEGSGRVRLV